MKQYIGNFYGKLNVVTTVETKNDHELFTVLVNVSYSINTTWLTIKKTIEEEKTRQCTRV